MAFGAGIRDYGGGGYVLRLKGYIDDLKDRIRLLQEVKWVNNATRATIVEFSVYNAQVNIFATVTCVAEFVGGGIVPWYRIESLRLFGAGGFAGNFNVIRPMKCKILFIIFVVMLFRCSWIFDHENLCIMHAKSV